MSPHNLIKIDKRPDHYRFRLGEHKQDIAAKVTEFLESLHQDKKWDNIPFNYGSLETHQWASQTRVSGPGNHYNILFAYLGSHSNPLDLAFIVRFDKRKIEISDYAGIMTPQCIELMIKEYGFETPKRVYEKGDIVSNNIAEDIPECNYLVRRVNEASKLYVLWQIIKKNPLPVFSLPFDKVEKHEAFNLEGHIEAMGRSNYYTIFPEDLEIYL